jgi:hypothetical protein
MMPNHFLTVGLCARNFNEIDDPDAVDFSTLEGANLCQVLMPMPDGLRGIVAGTNPCRYRQKKTGKWCDNCNGPEIDDRENWEPVELSPSEVAKLVADYGASNWYDWQCKSWGTKWGIYDLKVHRLGGDGSPVLIEFQSAWGPPNPAMMRRIDDYLCKAYALGHIMWIGHDPGVGRPVEIEVANSSGDPQDG